MNKTSLIVFFLLVSALPGISFAEVSARAYLADGNTPLELLDPNLPNVYRDIMEGTKLSIIVDSNTGDLWRGGALCIRDIDREFGALSGRDFNDVTNDWEGSRFEAAGEKARVREWIGPDTVGFQLYSYFNAVAGEWFIIDYNSVKPGICNVEFYDNGVSFFEPVYNLTFSHVPTRDFNDNNIVDFADYAKLTSCWGQDEFGDSDSCRSTDLNGDGKVEMDDLWLFTKYWLEKTE
ncbi:dockerin type I domain-containing protein [Planctomycetota bacterium]